MQATLMSWPFASVVLLSGEITLEDVADRRLGVSALRYS